MPPPQPSQPPFEHIVILTGAGISAESGLATFRDADGLWEHHDPLELATPEAFQRDPQLVHRFYNARRAQLASVAPNAAHRALARLQRALPRQVSLVTQNVDNLHERGGSPSVLHMHGELTRQRCQACGRSGPSEAVLATVTRCRYCHQPGGLRPDVVWFGEMPQHMAEIEGALARCDLFVAIGTSGTVYPAAGFVAEASRAGAATLEINVAAGDTSGRFDSCRLGPATEEVPRWVGEILAGA